MDKRKKLLQLIKKKALIKKKVKLSSGKTSCYYIDMRRITLSSQGLKLIVDLIGDFIKKNKITCIGGPVMGADPIVGGMLQKYNLKGFLVRKERKSHGTRSILEGNSPSKNDKVLIIDDVATTGNSLLKCVRLLKNKCKIIGCLCVFDRKEGAQENLRKENVNLFSLFSLDDIK